MAEAPSPYGRRRVARLGEAASTEPSPSPTYYGRPILKASGWRWLIATYMFVGGLAGAAQVIAGVVEVSGRRRDRPMIRLARYLGLAGALVSPLLLVADLHAPRRWYNMLRIYRGTSAMSIGSWTLVAFGTFSGLTAGCQIAGDVFRWRTARALARYLGVPAAAAGALLATYTGSLLAATIVPLWAVAYHLLPALFASSAVSTATAALSIVLRGAPSTRPSRQRLERLAVLAGVTELALMVRLDRLWRREGLTAALDRPALGMPYRVGVLGLGILAPLSVHLIQMVTGREYRRLAVLASVAALAGGYTLRAVLLLAGKSSAERPTDYFRMAQPHRADDLADSS